MRLQIAQIRRFNRTVTQRVGALNDRFLSRDRPLAISRLLWEIGMEGGEVVMLRSRLGVDSGQMSRMLRALEADGLVAGLAGNGLVLVEPPAARAMDLAVAPRVGDQGGGAEHAGPAQLVEADETQRAELVGAMRSVERLITTSLVQLRQLDPESPDAQRCLRAYVAELNRRAPQRGFDPRKGATAQPHEVRPPSGAFVVAYLRGEAIGCGAVKQHPRQRERHQAHVDR